MTTTSTARTLTRPLALVGLFALGGLPTFVITIVLALHRRQLLASGLGVFVAGN